MFRKMALLIYLVLASIWTGHVAADDLASAVKARDVEQVLVLLKTGADPNRRFGYETPIGLAASSGSPELVISLLDAGADPRIAGFGGLSPLHAAVLSRQSEIAKILIERGAKVDALDNFGRTPLLTYASSSTHSSQLLQILLKAGADPIAMDPATDISVLDYVAWHGHEDEAEVLIAAGAKVNSRDSLLKTPLHYAVNCCNGVPGNHDMVRSLIGRGADVNVKDLNGRTPLDYVRVRTPNAGLMINSLIEAGAR